MLVCQIVIKNPLNNRIEIRNLVIVLTKSTLYRSLRTVITFIIQHNDNTLNIKKTQCKKSFINSITLVITLVELNLFTSLDLIEVTVTILKMRFYDISVLLIS